MKEKVNMREWEVNIVQGEYNLSGRAEYHYRLGKNACITMTSTLVDYKITHEALIYETLNTIYFCPLKYMNINPYEKYSVDYVLELKEKTEKGKEGMDELILAAVHIACQKPYKSELSRYISKFQKIGYEELENEKKQHHEEMYKIVKKYKNSIYIPINNVKYGSELAYNIVGELGIIEPMFHCGMFQDSILYTKYSKEGALLLDFRYFPKWYGKQIKTYLWSSNIDSVIIRNDTGSLLMFNEENIEIGETRIFRKNSGEDDNNVAR